MALEQRMTGLDQAITAISENGAWNQNAYMRGLANGMIIARGILYGRKPQTHPEPQEYTDDAAERNRIAAEAPKKRGRGRPRKVASNAAVNVSPLEAEVAGEYDYEDEVSGQPDVAMGDGAITETQQP